MKSSHHRIFFTCRENTKTPCKVLLPHFVPATTHRSSSTCTTTTIITRVDNNNNLYINSEKIPSPFLLPLCTSSSTTKRFSCTERVRRSSSSAFAAFAPFSFSSSSSSSHKSGCSTRAMPRGKGGASSSSSSKEVDISKSLSYLLRHGARKEGLVLDEGGWANVADVLAWRRIASLKVNLDRLQSIVATNDKKRYQIELDPNGPLSDPSVITSTTSASDPASWRIRATQGHSITTLSNEQIFDPILLTDANCPSFVVHGTDRKSWKEIERSGGLKAMRRKHIHFATRLPERMPPLNPDFQSQSKPKPEVADKVISGMRNTSTVVIWVDVKASLEAGMKWWRSENEVVLTEGMGEPKMVGFEWIKWVETRGSEKILYGTKVDSADVWEMERRMDKLGIGLEDGEKAPQEEKVEGGKAPQEEVIEEMVPQEKAADGNEPAAAIKDHWDD